MAVFMLESDSVSNSASNVNSLTTQISDLGSSVSSYDTSCEEDFDFAGAKSVISSNLDACATKIQNTYKILETVVESHVSLQNGLKFGEDEGSDTASGETTGGGSSAGGYSGGSSGYSGGSSGGGSSSGGSSSGESSSGESSDGKDNTESEDDESKKDTTDESTDKETEDDSSTVEVKDVETDLTSVDYVYIKEDKISDDSKKIFNSENFEYNETSGYAMLGNRYVIACDASVGNVGDVIRFTQKDGTVVECVVGTNTTSEKSKSVVNFLVDSNSWSSKSPIDVSENLIENNVSIKNAGQYSVLDKLESDETIIHPITGSVTVEVKTNPGVPPTTLTSSGTVPPTLSVSSTSSESSVGNVSSTAAVNTTGNSSDVSNSNTGDSSVSNV